MIVDDPIDLNIGSTRKVFCNATIGDLNNMSDIDYVNSTLYFNPVGPLAGDDNNYHYTNSTCSIISGSEYSAEYSCSYNILYYANNGTWACNITAFDTSSASGSNIISSFVNDLVAIDVSLSTIDSR